MRREKRGGEAPSAKGKGGGRIASKRKKGGELILKSWVDLDVHGDKMGEIKRVD